MELTTAFNDFLSAVALPADVRARCIAEHRKLRKLLVADPELSKIIVAVFLQGSYKRGTINQSTADKKADVDVVVVTTLDSATVTPAEAHARFKSFLEKHYVGKWMQQGRSLGIELDVLCLDLVVTAAPSEAAQDAMRKASWLGDSERTASDVESRFATLGEFLKQSASEDWRSEPLLIPDRDANMWDQTHPLAQLEWTVAKNHECNGHFLKIVRSLKWWKCHAAPDIDHPKSYPWEHLIGDCCPTGVESIADGLTRALEAFVSDYQGVVAAGGVPASADRGIPTKNVMQRTDAEDFAQFYQRVFRAAQQARTALDMTDRRESALAWAALLGEEFPVPPEPKFTERNKKTSLQAATFA